MINMIMKEYSQISFDKGRCNYLAMVDVTTSSESGPQPGGGNRAIAPP